MTGMAIITVNAQLMIFLHFAINQITLIIVILKKLRSITFFSTKCWDLVLYMESEKEQPYCLL